MVLTFEISMSKTTISSIPIDIELSEALSISKEGFSILTKVKASSEIALTEQFSPVTSQYAVELLNV